VKALVGLVALLLGWALATYPPTYVWRVVLWQDSDVFDYRRFPKRHIENAGSPFHFAAGSEEDEALVRTLFENNPLIGDLDKFLEGTRTQAFIVIQNDRILYEKYFNGFQRNSIVTSFSVAKSFISALIGIAIEEGHIESADDPMAKYLPELGERDAAFNKITIRNLLMMSSGIK